MALKKALMCVQNNTIYTVIRTNSGEQHIIFAIMKSLSFSMQPYIFTILFQPKITPLLSVSSMPVVTTPILTDDGRLISLSN